jgi:uncharacterized repeat protein (TIGR01451 family)
MTLALYGKSRARRRTLLLAGLLAVLVAVIAGVLGRSGASVTALQIDSSGGTWTGITGGANIEGLNSAEIRWGGSTSTENKSGYRWDGIGAPIVFGPGDSFLVGKFTHFNLPISSGTAPSAVTLTLPIAFSDPAASANLVVTFGHHETPNSADPCAYTGPLVDNSNGCADRVSLPTLNNQQFQVGDNLYVLTFTGFLPLTGESCPADPTGPDLGAGAVSVFYTKENAVNVACVYGTLTYTAPVVSVHKTATPASVDLGDPISFTIEVWNSSAAAASGWSLTDTLPAGFTWTMTSGPAACGITGNTLSCSGLDIPSGTPQDPGKVTIVVSADTSPTDYGICGQVPNQVSIAKGALSDSGSATVTIVCPPPPVLTLDKSANPATYSAVGQVIQYEYLVKNTGGQILPGPVTVTDDKVTVACPPGDLAPNQAITCTASYTITQADINAGSVTNVAQAHAGDLSSNQDTETVTAVQGPAISLEKTATSVIWAGTPTQAPIAYRTIGDVIHYTLVATNTGNVTLTDVTVSDPLLGTLSCSPVIPAVLAPGDSVSCTGSHAVTQADLDAGSFPNTATATGKPPVGANVTDTDDETVPAEQSPSLALVKTATPTTYSTLNEAVSYEYKVTNTGNVTLPSPITVLDDKVTVACPAGALAPGASITCTATYYITQADLNNGSVTNTARAYAGEVQSNEDDETVTAVQSPAITLTKTVDQENYDAVGDTLTYTLVAQNTGNVTLTNVTISDPKLGTLSCDIAAPVTLAPGAKLTCTGSYTVDLADLIAGKVENTASTQGTPPAGPNVTDTDDADVPALWIRALELEKTASPKTYSFVGQQVTYSYRVTNTGNIPLTGPVTVTDDKATVVCPSGGLQPGAWLDCSATYTITQADLDNGSVTNIATAASVADGVESEPDDETVTAAQSPAISLVKTATSANWSGSPFIGFNAVGDVLTYTLVATNTGNVTLTNVTITDPKLGTLSCDIAAPVTLAPGAELTCTGSYTITQADLDAGKVDNTATTQGTPPSGPAVTDDDDETVSGTRTPGIALTKTATESSYDAVGDVLTYTLVATNTGNVTLTDVTITDPKLGTLSCDSAAPVTLAPGAKLTCTGSYTVLLADINAGKVDNTATATGTPPAGANVTDGDDETVPAIQIADISLTKEAAEASFDAVGDELTYTLVATNTGNVTLTNVTISDPTVNPLLCVQPVTLAPGETLTCTATYVVTQADLDAGGVKNLATTKGTPPGGDDVTDEADETVPAVQRPAINLVKTATNAIWGGAPLIGFNAVGDIIEYTLVAENTGNVTLTNVTITDPKLGTLSCDSAAPVTLAPGEKLTCTGSYAITLADLDAGKVDNFASTTGAPPVGDVVTDDDDETVSGVRLPDIGLVKTATSANWSGSPFIGFNAVGDVLTYTLVATNTGNVTLTNVTITDPKLGTLSCDIAAPVTLAPGAELTCTGSYTITQADLDAGKVDNTATTQGTPPSGPAVTDDDDETVSGTRTPGIALTKTATESSYDAVGDVLTYTLVATNTGNVTLTDVTITDPKLGTLSCDSAAPVTLAPGAKLTCTGSYAITQADLDAGKVDNTATATGTPPAGDDVTDNDDETVPAVQRPAISVTKTSTEIIYDAVDDVITYTLVATNTGNVTLTNVTISDPKLGTLSCDSAAPVTLAPGEKLTCTGSYAVTLGDLDHGRVDNTATATGTPPTGPDVSDDDDETVYGTRTPVITLTKTVAEADFAAVGDILTYTLVAENTGNVTLTNVTITDPKLGALSCDIAAPVTLAPREKLTCTGSYTITQADLDAGDVENLASTKGTPPEGDDVTDEDDATVPAVQQPDITLTKDATQSTYDAVNDVLTYTLVATNTGNVTLTDVTITDPKLGTLSCDIAAPVTLAPGEKLTCTGSYAITQADLDAGEVENLGSATGTPPSGPPVTDEDDEDVPATQSPAIDLLKTATNANWSGSPFIGFNAVGDVLTYTLVATNTGNVTLTNVTISDPKLGTLSCDIAVPVALAPGEKLTCTGSYAITQADLDAGKVDNTATTQGTPPSGPAVTDDDDETVSGTRTPGIALTKTATESSYDAVGDVITYTLVATNTGNVTLTDVTITDPKLGTLSCDSAAPVTLAPGAKLTCTGSYTVVLADIDAGKVDNTATATGTPPAGPAVTDEDDATVPGVQRPAISLVKTVVQPSYSAVGDVLDYTLVATNTGNVTLTNVTITDPKLGLLACDIPAPVTLVPGASLRCTGSYTTTLVDVLFGSVMNTATVTGTPPSGPAVTDTDTATVPVVTGPPPSPTPTPTPTPPGPPGPGQTPVPSPTPTQPPAPTPTPTEPIIDIVEGERTPGPGAPTGTPPATPKPPQTGAGFDAVGYGGPGIGFVLLGIIAVAGGIVVAWFGRKPRQLAAAAAPAATIASAPPARDEPAATSSTPQRPATRATGVVLAAITLAGAFALAVIRTRRR